MIRPVGAGHARAALIAEEEIVSLHDAVVPPQLDSAAGVVTVSAGSTWGALSSHLAGQGMALATLSDAAHVSLGSALRTGAHGTGGGFGPLHSMVTAVEMVDGLGQVRWWRGEELPAARCALGSLGIATRYELRVQPAFRLASTVARVPLDDVLADFDHHVADHRHASFDWVPWTRWAQLRLADVTHAPTTAAVAARHAAVAAAETAGMWLVGRAMRALPASAARLGQVTAALLRPAVESRGDSHEALTRSRPARVDETAAALPRAALQAVIGALEALVRRERLPVLPVEVRAVAADTSAWLSPAWRRDSVCVAVRTVPAEASRRVLAGAEAILRGHGGRPHWGTLHSLDAESLAPLYPRWNDFQAVREDADPIGVFRSAQLRRLLG